MQFENHKNNLVSSLSDHSTKPSITSDNAFGPQLSQETLTTLPGTPLPSLLPDEEGELLDVDFSEPPKTPPDKEEVKLQHCTYNLILKKYQNSL